MKVNAASVVVRKNAENPRKPPSYIREFRGVTNIDRHMEYLGRELECTHCVCVVDPPKVFIKQDAANFDCWCLPLVYIFFRGEGKREFDAIMNGTYEGTGYVIEQRWHLRKHELVSQMSYYGTLEAAELKAYVAFFRLPEGKPVELDTIEDHIGP